MNLSKEKSLYTEIAEKLRDMGGIDEIGVVTGNGRTAISYAGNKVLKEYFGGTKKLSLIFQITGMDINSRQRSLIDRLVHTGDLLCGAEPVIPGIFQARVKVNSLPAPTVHDESSWIYAMCIEITFYTKG